MTNERKAVAFLAVFAALVVVGPPPAVADWLMTREGDRIETKGPWRVDGRQVLFTLPNGTLSSLRADEVDLDLSALETRRAREAQNAPAAPAPKREPVLRLTEKDLPPMRAEEAEEGPAKKGGEPAGDGLEVLSWEKTESANGDGIELFGTLRNNGKTNITSPTLMVMIYGEDGGLLATNTATINAGIITVGKTANFRVAFPGVPDFAAVKFDPRGRGFQTRTEAAGEGEEGAEGESGIDTQISPEEAAAAAAAGAGENVAEPIDETAPEPAATPPPAP